MNLLRGAVIFLGLLAVWQALVSLTGDGSVDELREGLENGTARIAPINANERIAVLTEWLDTTPLPLSIAWEWTGDQEEQAESQEFLSKAFLGALALMFNEPEGGRQDESSSDP